MRLWSTGVVGGLFFVSSISESWKVRVFLFPGVLSILDVSVSDFSVLARF